LLSFIDLHYQREEPFVHGNAVDDDGVPIGTHRIRRWREAVELRSWNRPVKETRHKRYIPLLDPFDLFSRQGSDYGDLFGSLKALKGSDHDIEDR